MNLTLNLSSCLFLTEKLLLFGLVLQSLEYIFNQNYLSESGVWRWKDLKLDYLDSPKLIQSALDLILSWPNFKFVLFIRLFVVLVLFFYSQFWLWLGVFLLSLIILIRFRGVFNGGSDYMSMQVLGALTYISYFKLEPKMVLGGLWYISVQLMLSYFISGWIKVRKESWRSGKALSYFLNSPVISLKPNLSGLSENKYLILFASWTVMIMELLFPFSLGSAKVALLLCLFFIGFHMFVWQIYGLNRFFWAWIAAYPALIFCAGLS